MPATANCPATLFDHESREDLNFTAAFKSLQPTPVFSVFWPFAAERQAIFWRRIHQQSPPWTTDPILAIYKFTNVYRASDRVSQYLIRNVIYAGEQNAQELVFRVLLFKLFNKIETWQLLQDKFGALTWKSFSLERYDRVLSDAFASKRRIYSAAYIMPSGSRQWRSTRKHRTHLELLQYMMNSGLPKKVAACRRLKALYELLRSYPLLGEFLAYQYAIDLNYSDIVSFDESEFIVAGPGARGGIAKCFGRNSAYSDADIIRMVTEQQEDEFESRKLNFASLGGRRLQLIDTQNLFCEIDKYARVRFPERNNSGRTRIKQRFTANPSTIPYWYPPKWKINEAVTVQIPSLHSSRESMAAD